MRPPYAFRLRGHRIDGLASWHSIWGSESGSFVAFGLRGRLPTLPLRQAVVGACRRDIKYGGKLPWRRA